MNKLLLILLVISNVSHSASGSHTEALALREQMLHSLGQFNPSAVLPGYTINPKEAQLSKDNLKNDGFNNVRQNQTAGDIYHEAESRNRVVNDPNSLEMKQAEQLIENAETVLKQGVPCADGSCDLSETQMSNDMGESVSRLGALAGGANEVSTQQAGNRPTIFAGNTMQCKKYPLGIRDCCTDSGWGDWVKHCPQDMQVLMRAKQDNRVVFLGSYKRNKLSSRHYVFCVFPNKLASIVQIEGRLNQLHINFGSPKSPNCRGLMPTELERIDFSALNLVPVEQEFLAKFNSPSNSHTQTVNQSHIERLNQKGRPYD